MRRIRGSARPRMPLDGPPYLSEAEVALISRWIDAGAYVEVRGRVGDDGAVIVERIRPR